jgi:transcriptional regulator with XRE-family HTH domain
MKRTVQPAGLAGSRAQIAKKVGELRNARGLTQAELSKRLGLSQARLSQIERGGGSFSAEQFLEILRLFNVAPAAFGEPTDEGAELQNALARSGAPHLRENDRVLPSAALGSLPEIIAKTLLRADSSRQLTALAPVLVHNVEDVRLSTVERELRDVGLVRRLGWVLENTVAAVRVELQNRLTHKTKQIYLRAELLIESHLEYMRDRAARESMDPLPWDPLDKSIRSRRTLDEVKASASAISEKWRIATKLQVEDFARALGAARVG